MKSPKTSPNSPPVPPLDIVILDDDSDFCQYLEDILVDEGHRVRITQEPESFFVAVEGMRPDLVLLDMNMGPHRGEEVLAELRDRDPNLCVIILTGYPSLEDMRATFRLRVFDYLAKPFSLAEFREALQRAAHTLGLGKNQLDRLREKLGHRIKVLRIEKKWSLKELAQETGVSVSQLSSIERGTHLPSIESLLTVSTAFERRPSELLADIQF